MNRIGRPSYRDHVAFGEADLSALSSGDRVVFNNRPAVVVSVLTRPISWKSDDGNGEDDDEDGQFQSEVADNMNTAAAGGMWGYWPQRGSSSVWVDVELGIDGDLVRLRHLTDAWRAHVIVRSHAPVCSGCGQIWPCAVHDQVLADLRLAHELEQLCYHCDSKLGWNVLVIPMGDGVTRRFHANKRKTACIRAARAAAREADGEVIVTTYPDGQQFLRFEPNNPGG